MKKHYRHEKDCLNCGTDLQGNFCHNCGQENLEMKESFGHMLNHAVSDYFHFDYQFFHTLKPLFTQPGKLTVDYLAGRRAQYLHPVKMYIFISLVFFVLFFKVNSREVVHVNNAKENKGGVHLTDNAKSNLLTDIDNDGSLSPDEKKKIKGVVGNYLPGATEKAKPAADTLHKAETEADEEDPDPNNSGNLNFVSDDKGAKSYEEYLANQSKLPEADRDNFLYRYIKKKSFDWKNQGKNAKEILIESVRHNSPKVMFAILPLFALILKIAFRKNHKLYVEHIIYSIHLHCFVFLFLTATLLLQLILPHSWEKPVMDWVQLLIMVGIAWYVYRSFRVFYQRSRWRTVSKMIGVSLMYFITSLACIFVFIIIIAITSV